MLTAPELALLLQLLVFAYDKKSAWPGHEKLSQQGGMSVSTVRHNLVSLEKKAFLKRVYRNGTSNKYDLIPTIERLRNHVCHPAKKQTPHYQKPDTPHYQKTDTKEDISLRRKLNKKGGIECISEIIQRRILPTRQVDI
jgi:hypothetical protein